MSTLSNIIKQLQSTSSKNEKIEILKANKDNELLQAYLRATYEPRISYYVKPEFLLKLPDARFDTSLDGLTVGVIESCNAVLGGRIATGGAARTWLTSLYMSLPYEERELLFNMIGRDLRAGMSGSTISKVWPDLLSKTVYMRCCGVSDIKKDEWFNGTNEIYAQTKADGMFVNFRIETDGTHEITSRQGETSPADKFDHIATELKKNVTEATIFHGELLVRNILTGKIAPRQDGNGQLNSLRQGDDIDTGNEIVFVVWDAIPASQAVKKNKYTVPYKERFATLQGLVSGSDHVSIVKTKIVKTWEEAMAFYKEQLLLGEEGTVNKHPDGVWSDGTSKHQFKLKMIVDVDLVVVGFKEGRGKNAKTFGSLTFQTRDGLLEVGVSGMPDKLRQELHENRAGTVGTIWAVRGNAVMEPSSDTGGLYSLYLPRLVEKRTDKVEADSLAEVIQQFKDAIDA